MLLYTQCVKVYVPTSVVSVCEGLCAHVVSVCESLCARVCCLSM